MNHQLDRWMESLTLEEKASLCSGLDLWHTKAIPRLGIPSMTLTDGPHGVRLAETGILSQMRIMAMNGTDTIESSTKRATCFPTASAMAATWNTDLVEHIGEAMGREAKSIGVDLLLAPGINIVRTPLGGRNFEYFSEDPILSSKFGIAMTRGIQSQGVGAVVKHFACNNSEFRRMTVDVVVDERTLHELYLKAFKRLIEHVDPAAILSAYNKVNGEYCSESEMLLTKILRGKWDYDGLVISDWAAVYDRLKALQAGLDLEMPGFAMHDEEIVKAVREGLLDEVVLDRSVRRLLKCILDQSMKMNVSVQSSEHHGLATHAASESFVLLKNEGILPIQTDRPVKLALFGAGWNAPVIQGEGSSKVRPIKVDNPLRALEESIHKDSEVRLIKRLDGENLAYLENCDMAIVLISNIPVETSDLEYMWGGDEVSLNSDFLSLNIDGEGEDKISLSVPLYYEYLISRISQIQENIVVGLMSGGPVDVSEWVDEVKGLIMLWLSGEGMGQAVADVLTGVVNPSGKLPISWPKSEGHTSSSLHFPGENDKLYYSDRIYVGYKYALSTGLESLYPFGFGMSYTSFELTGVSVERDRVHPGDTIKAVLEVNNTGKLPGKTVVQAYARRIGARVQYPLRQLVAFEKVTLQPGESKSIELFIEADDLTYYNVKTGEFELEPGEVLLEFGDSSVNILMTKQIMAVNPKMYKPYLSKYSYLSEWLDDEDGKGVILEALRPFVPFEEIPLDHPIVVMFKEMPLIKIVNFSGGLVSEDFLDHLELSLVKRRDQKRESD